MSIQQRQEYQVPAAAMVTGPAVRREAQPDTSAWQVRLDPEFKVGEGEPLRMLKYGEAGLVVPGAPEGTC
eukprot:Skav213334  [mRNA]  locus=scaffold3340:327134:328347:+ [translate_table: standard]